MEELEASLEKYSDYYELAPIGYLTIDEIGQIVEINLSGAQTLGVAEPPLRERSLERFIHPESRLIFRLFLVRVFSDAKRQTCELKMINKGEGEKHVCLEGMAIYGNKQAAKQCRAVMTDITERKQVEKEFESFSYSITHDLREPLRAIDGYSRMLSKDLQGTLDESAQRKLNSIREKARRMEQLIDDIFSFHRLSRQDLNLTLLDLEKLASEVWSDLGANDRKGEIKLTIGQLPGGWGDEKLLRQLMAHLLGNAVKFTAGLPVPTIAIGGEESLNACVYHIRDNGIGFDMRFYDKLFNIFQRLHRDDEYEGTGVGLAIVKRIAERHGGQVWAEGKDGEGATFYFSLPKRM